MTANPPAVPLWTYAPNPWSWLPSNNRRDLRHYSVAQLSLVENFALPYEWELEVAYDTCDGIAWPAFVDGYPVDEKWGCSTLNGETVSFFTLVDLLTEREFGSSRLREYHDNLDMWDQRERRLAWKRLDTGAEVAA